MTGDDAAQLPVEVQATECSVETYSLTSDDPDNGMTCAGVLKE